MTQAQWSIVRFAICCAAWAGAEALCAGLGIRGAVRDLAAVVAAVGAYVLTMSGPTPGRRDGNIRYWRGRRID